MNFLNLKKKKLLDEMLNDDHVLLHVDSTNEKVRVPDSCKNNPVLTLKISRLFYGKVELQEDGLLSQLKFSGQYFDCFFPWDAVWGVTSDKGAQKIWEDFAPGVIAAMKKEASVEIPTEVSEKVPVSEKPKSFLKRIK